MKYINLLANTYELNCLFPTAKIKSYKVIENYSISKIILEVNNETFELVHYIENVFDKLSNLENILNINSLYTSPIDDLTIICDRKLWSELYFPLMRHHKDIFEKLEKICSGGEPVRPISLYLKIAKRREIKNGEIIIGNEDFTVDIFDISWRRPLF